MVQASRHDIDGFLDLANTLIRDDTAAVLDAVASKVTYIVDRLVDPRDRPRYQAWIRERVGPALRQLGLPGDANDDPNLQGRRATLLSLVGMTADDTEVQRLARDLALRYLADPTSVPPTLASTILNVAALGGDEELYEKYLAKLRQAKQEPEVYYQFFNALPYFRQPALVRRTLELSLSQEIRSQDAATLVGGLMEVPWGENAAWAFVEGRWDALTAKLETFQGIPRMIRSMSTFCSAERAADMKRFFMQHPVPSSERTIQQQIERVESCAALRSRQGHKLGAWIAAR
jgi:aminopeptidase N